MRTNLDSLGDWAKSANLNPKPSTALATGIPSVGLAKNETTEKSTYAKIKTVFPLVEQLQTYDTKLFMDDVVSALTIAFILLPQAIAYAPLARTSTIQSLMSSMFPPLLYVIFGASRQLSVGPEAMIAVIVGATIDTIGTDVYSAQQQAITMAFLVGVGLITLSLLRAGFMENIMSGFMLVGFVLGVSNLICTEQIPGLFGLNITLPGEASAVVKIQAAVQGLGTANSATVVIGLLNITFLFGFKLFKMKFGHMSVYIRKAPETFILLVAMIAISAGLDLKNNYNVKILGQFDHAIPAPAAPFLNGDIIGKLLGPSCIIMIVGFIECQTVTKKFSMKNRYNTNTDQELFTFGFMNIIVAFLGGFPTFGSLPRSRILSKAGGNTTLANGMAAVVVIIVSQLLVPLLQYLPKTTLASIVIIAAVGLIEVHEISYICKMRAWYEVFMFIVTWALTVGFAISTGIIFCLGFSALLIIRRATETSMTVIGRVRDFETSPNSRSESDDFAIDILPPMSYQDIANHPHAELMDGVVIMRVLAPLMFYNVGQVASAMGNLINGQVNVLRERKRRRMERDLQERSNSRASDETIVVRQPWWKDGNGGRDDLHTIVLDFKGCVELDAFAVLMLHKIFHSYEKQGVRCIVTNLTTFQIGEFQRAGYYEHMKNNIFPCIETAVVDVEARIGNSDWRKEEF
ncbi:sulfate transporter family-domain-containing protein [Chytriomyces sp. MP71]|nr:sulfate transporter family-domain-containing protein [Chytriomyces sp. MP71]